MENLIARVAAAAHTTPETARQAVALIVDFIRREGPESAVDTLMAKAPALHAIGATAHGASGEGMGATLKGMMGTGAGAMGGGGLMALGGRLSKSKARSVAGMFSGEREKDIRARELQPIGPFSGKSQT